MAGELGLKHTFRERIWEPLQLYRGSDGTPGKEISFEEFCQKKAVNNEGGLGLTGTDGLALTWDHIWNDLGLDPARTTIDNLLALGGDLRYIAPEQIRQFIWTGIITSVNHMDLCASEEHVTSLHVVQPRLNTSTNAEMQEVGEAETLPEGEISWTHKSVELKEIGTSITISDRIILSVPINLLERHLSFVGRLLAVKLYREAVTVLINGDQDDSSETCATVGVGSTTDKAKFADFVRLWARASLIGMNWGAMVTSEVMANQVLALPQFEPNQGIGTAQVQLDSRLRIIPASMPHLVSSVPGDNQILLIDKDYALQYLVFRALMVENERIIMKRINGTAVSMMCGFTTLLRHARILMDQTQAFSAAGFPAFMAPTV